MNHFNGEHILQMRNSYLFFVICATSVGFATTRILIRDKRYHYKKQFLLWQDGIVTYAIDDAFDESEVKQIRNGFDEVERQSCVRFIPQKSNGIETAEYALNILRESDTKLYSKGNAYTTLKYQQQEVDGVNVTTFTDGNITCPQACFTYLGTLVHELLHILGFSHEHSRPDRDDYVTFVYNKTVIDISTHNQYTSQFTADFYETWNTPYDPSSLMHYGDTDQIKIQHKYDPVVRLGQPFGMTELDIYRLRRLYSCPNFNPAVMPPINKIVYFRCKNWPPHSNLQCDRMATDIKATDAGSCESQKRDEAEYDRKVKKHNQIMKGIEEAEKKVSKDYAFIQKMVTEANLLVDPINALARRINSGPKQLCEEKEKHGSYCSDWHQLNCVAVCKMCDAN